MQGQPRVPKSPPPSSSHSTAGHIINPTSPAARQAPNHTYLGEGKSLFLGGGRDSRRSGINDLCGRPVRPASASYYLGFGWRKTGEWVCPKHQCESP